VQGVSRKQVAWLNLKRTTEARLDKAIAKINSEYKKYRLIECWGSGSSVSADGKLWDLYEDNLLSEYHIRYGSYGGIAYYHVSDTYIALFSRFIPCGVYEAIYILDGLLRVSLNISAIWLVANENHLHLSINTDNSFLCTIMRCNIIDHNFAKSDFKCVA